jgi:hypothetical protein
VIPIQVRALKVNTIDRIRFFIEDHPWGVTGTLLALLVGVVIAWGLTASSDSQISDLKDQLADARHEASSLRDRLQKLTTQRDEAIDHARAGGAHAEGKVARQRRSRRTARDQRAQAPDQKEQGSVPPAKQTLKASTIPDGTWQYGRDYEAGTYRAPGGEGCYWSTLRDANPRHIIDYGVSVKRPTVKLGPDTPFFKTVHCGKWVETG